MISKETATKIALEYREIETAEKLLAEVRETVQQRGEVTRDLRDVFGRMHDALELGVPSGDTGKRLFRVPYPLAAVVIEAHIAACKSNLEVLHITAAKELGKSGRFASGGATRVDIHVVGEKPVEFLKPLGDQPGKGEA